MTRTTSVVAVRHCHDCEAGLDHCHDTLVVHVSEWTECPDPGCDAALERHRLVVACTQLDPGCPCG